jgi:hypothetical protein
MERILFTMSKDQYLSHTYTTCLTAMANELNYLNNSKIFTVEGKDIFCDDSTEIQAIFNLGRHAEYLNKIIENEK